MFRYHECSSRAVLLACFRWRLHIHRESLCLPFFCFVSRVRLCLRRSSCPVRRPASPAVVASSPSFLAPRHTRAAPGHTPPAMLLELLGFEKGPSLLPVTWCKWGGDGAGHILEDAFEGLSSWSLHRPISTALTPRTRPSWLHTRWTWEI